MPFSFPANPSLNQQSSQNGRTYAWNGYAWDLVGNVAVHATSHTSSGTDPLSLTSSQISDFNSSVSGILPVKNITAGTNIQATSTTGNYTIAVTGITDTIFHPFLLMGG